jgi:hypothetical protein
MMAELNILNHVARQYRASLTMLGHAVEMCSETLWLDESYTNRYWHIAYHALFYTHLYLQRSEADFRPWAKHRQDCQYLGPRPWAPQEPRKVETPYTKADVLDYNVICCAEVEARVPGLELEAPSGFSWLPFNKMELQFYNIRHIQHHTGQLADRLRTRMNIGLAWARPD